MIIKQMSINKHKGMVIPKYGDQTKPIKNCVRQYSITLAVMKFGFPLPDKPVTTSSGDDGIQHICTTLQHVFTYVLCDNPFVSLDYRE